MNNITSTIPISPAKRSRPRPNTRPLHKLQNAIRDTRPCPERSRRDAIRTLFQQFRQRPDLQKLRISLPRQIQTNQKSRRNPNKPKTPRPIRREHTKRNRKTTRLPLHRTNTPPTKNGKVHPPKLNNYQETLTTRHCQT